MNWTIVLDIVISVLLIATIGYAVMLNSRLTALRKNRDDLAKIIVAFNEATVRAEASIPKLKKAAEDAGLGLQERVEKAQSLRDDLAFMIERADTMANRLENGVRNARTEVRQPQPAAGGSVTGTAGATMPPSRLGGLGGGPKQATVAAAAAAAEADSDERSEAERELLRALQSMR